MKRPFAFMLLVLCGAFCGSAFYAGQRFERETHANH